MHYGLNGVVPGIPQQYHHRSADESRVYEPNDIWKLRHLKPYLRQKVHRKFQELATRLMEIELKTEPYWKLWSLIKSKSEALRHREKEFYRQHKHLYLREGEQDEWQKLPPWHTLVRYQSYPVYIDRDGRPKRLSRVWPTEIEPGIAKPPTIVADDMSVTKRGVEKINPEDGSISKKSRLESAKCGTQLDFDLQITQLTHRNSGSDEHTDLETNLPENANIKQSAAVAQAIDPQEAARQIKIDVDNALYIDYKDEIEYI
jgi:hypothetical protein